MITTQCYYKACRVQYSSLGIVIRDVVISYGESLCTKTSPRLSENWRGQLDEVRRLRWVRWPLFLWLEMCPCVTNLFVFAVSSRVMWWNTFQILLYCHLPKPQGVNYQCHNRTTNLELNFEFCRRFQNQSTQVLDNSRNHDHIWHSLVQRSDPSDNPQSPGLRRYGIP